MDWYVATDDGEVLLFSTTHDLKLDFRAFDSLEAVHGLLVGYDFAHVGLSVDSDDAVAGEYADFLGWTALDDVVDVHGVVLDGELYANA